MRPAAFLVLLALLLPGCATPASVTPASREAALAPASAPACVASPDAKGTTANFEKLGALPPEEDHPGFHGELAAHRDARGLTFARVREFDGFVELYDATDPLAIRKLGEYGRMPNGYALDAKFDPEGDAIVAGDIGDLVVLDVRDPTHPVPTDTFRFPAPWGNAGVQSHMIQVHVIGNRTRVFAASQSGAGVWIFDLVGEPGARKLQLLTQFAPLVGGPIAPHDVAVVDDPILRKPLLVLADGFTGWLAADASDPAHPQIVGVGLPTDPYVGYAHSVAVAFVGERRLVVTIAEVGANTMRVYDATDLAKPTMVGEWIDDATNPTAPQHDLQVVGDRLYVAHYQRGVFVFNLSAAPTTPAVPGVSSLAPVAHIHVDAGPEPSSLLFLASLDDGFHGAIKALVEGGLVYVATIDEGIQVYRDGCLAPGAASPG